MKQASWGPQFAPSRSDSVSPAGDTGAEIPLVAAVRIAKFHRVSLDYLAGLTNDKKPL